MQPQGTGLRLSTMPSAHLSVNRTSQRHRRCGLITLVTRDDLLQALGLQDGLYHTECGLESLNWQGVVFRIGQFRMQGRGSRLWLGFTEVGIIY